MGSCSYCILPKHIRETLTLRKKKKKNKKQNKKKPLETNTRPSCGQWHTKSEQRYEGCCGGKTQLEKELPVEDVVRDMGLDGRGICG
jgi:hypothetical protein